MTDLDKMLLWVSRRLKTLQGADAWDADDFAAGQMAMLREIEDLIENDYFTVKRGTHD